MFERFTERARQVAVLAQEEARTLKHNYIGTEHILLGLLREAEGLAAHVLIKRGVTADVVRTRVRDIVGAGEKITSGQIPFTPRAKKVLELSLREALSLGHNYIGTEHLLLALVREDEGVACRILREMDLTATAVRDETMRQLTVTRPKRIALPTEWVDRPEEQEDRQPIDSALTAITAVLLAMDVPCQVKYLDAHRRGDGKRVYQVLKIEIGSTV